MQPVSRLGVYFAPTSANRDASHISAAAFVSPTAHLSLGAAEAGSCHPQQQEVVCGWFRGQHAAPAELTSIIQPTGLWKCLIVQLCPVVSWFEAGRWEIFRWPQEEEEIEARSLVAQVNVLPMKLLDERKGC